MLLTASRRKGSSDLTSEKQRTINAPAFIDIQIAIY